MVYFWAYLFSTVGGLVLMAPIMRLMHRTSVPYNEVHRSGVGRPFIKWSDVWVGCTERAIATTLWIWVPAHLPLFIGGWIALKAAGSWAKVSGPDSGAQAHHIALVGNAFSFAIAISVGYFVEPQSLGLLQSHPE